MKSNICKFNIHILIILVCILLIGCQNKTAPNDNSFFNKISINNQNSSVNMDPGAKETQESVDTITEISESEIPVSIVNQQGKDKSKEEASVYNEIKEYVQEGEAVIVINDKPASNSSALKLKFKKTSETVYATANVNVRSTYTIKANNIVTVLKKGNSIQRIGIQKEWSKVVLGDRTCYIKTNYLTLQKPVKVAPTAEPSSTSTKQNTALGTKTDFVAKLNIASKINQLVCVIGNGGSDSIVSFHTKSDDGNWKQVFSIDGDVGSKGITYNKKDGDGKTPAGLYSFTLAFGIKPDPGAKLSYRQVTKYDYWVDDLDSPYYNTWVNSLETPGNYTTEHLIDHNPSYNYAMNINSNGERIPGLGSAIFLHCYNGKGRTSGCVAISEKYMKTLIQKLDSSAMILIVPNSDDLANY